VSEEKKKKYLLKVDAYAGVYCVHLSVFMFINGLHAHVSLFEEFHT